MKKVLIIRLSSIGDIVLTTPVIRCLKQQVKDVLIHYIVKPPFVDVLKENPYIDKLHVYTNNGKSIIQNLKNEKFDYIIDLHRNIRTSRIKSSLKVQSFSFKKLNIKKWLYVNFKINRMPDIHIVDRYLQAVKKLNVLNDKKGLDYFLADSDIVNIKTLPESYRNGYILFAVGAKHNTKKLSSEKIISLCKKLYKPIIIAGGKEDFAIAEEVEKHVGENIYNACGKYSINQSASLVKQANLVITHDTGLMHIAAAFKKKIISIWGNTVPEFGMYPYKADKKSKIIQVEDLKCRPCSKIGHKKCPKNHFKCMNDIDEDIIVKYANELYPIKKHR